MRKGKENWGSSSWRREGSEDLIHVYKYLTGENEDERASLLSAAPTDMGSGSS